MNTAFGSGNWSAFYGFSDSVFGGGNSFVYLEGGDGAGIADFFASANTRTALESFVLAGGAVFVNAARNDTSTPFDVGFGLTLVGANYSDTGSLTSAGIEAGLGSNGAGTAWSGSSFGHDYVVCAFEAACEGNVSTFVTGDSGDIVVGGRFGDGYFVAGGQTLPYFHQPSEGAAALRANQLNFVASLGTSVGGSGVVPEPASWAMLIAGFGLTGAALRRRRAVFA
ncbi:hypothetical protein FHS79_000609 [Polymorphobacter multimanifer]|uniref:Ice-binding protein C-terminal domain-containing protein n=1 Tax=Polymorphobacter multimanifer TaxID=1070431 RepID=A0A841L9E1_9SPHN|nr:PEPxxWA-CTERM sorting domain-containing protein [Polymorphobacter multimanifer]MBB6226455.1 hypothetical protein [Polymorphobacter multimanifer]